MRLNLKVMAFTLFVSTTSFCQQQTISDSFKCVQYVDTLTNRQLYKFPDKEAHYKGGEGVFEDYFQRNYSLSKNHVELRTYLFVTFIVEVDGSVSNVALKFPAHGLTDEAISNLFEVIKKMPNLKPAICNKQPVATRFTQPIILSP